MTGLAKLCIHVYMSGSVISLRVDEAQKRRLDELATKTGRPKAFYIREAIEAYLDDAEYIYELQTEAEAVRRGELETVTLDELKAECGLAD